MTNKLKHIAVSGIFVLAVLVSCKTKSKTTSIDFEKEGYTRAIIRNYELDGCRYMIFLDETKKLEPDWLPMEMQKDSVPVWVKYERDERMSICMAGETVKVIDIKKR
ncbi:MAG: hypothetical protein FD123_1765 [Bacteroidetes bacterium]|nr:MAG: hypothetical protein FD123_1765 [Bacteroidota bacterium]